MKGPDNTTGEVKDYVDDFWLHAETIVDGVDISAAKDPITINFWWSVFNEAKDKQDSLHSIIIVNGDKCSM